MRKISFATFNLYNLNEPELAIYSDRDGWDQDQYDRKIDYTARALQRVSADVIGFQELWHEQSLKNAFDAAGLVDEYDLLIPEGHSGEIACAAAVRKSLRASSAQWIKDFPDFFKLHSSGDDPQTPEIAVAIDSFSRPVLSFEVTPRDDQEPILIYVCHFKSKGPTKIYREAWYNEEKETYKNHVEALGSALSTIRRTAEAAALRLYLTLEMKGTNKPVVVLGDLNDDQHSNTLAVLTGDPNFLLTGDRKGGSDVDLYTTQTLQAYRSQKDVYYTHVYKKVRSSLDHILVSEQFFDSSRRRVWGFDELVIDNDHLNYGDHKTFGTNDHGIVKAIFRYAPLRVLTTDDDDDEPMV